MIGTGDGQQYENQFDHALNTAGDLVPSSSKGDRIPVNQTPQKSQEPAPGRAKPYTPTSGWNQVAQQTIPMSPDVFKNNDWGEYETKVDKYIGDNKLQKDDTFKVEHPEGPRFYKYNGPNSGGRKDWEETHPSVNPEIGSLNPNIQAVLSQPHIQEAINNPKIDRTHDVPYEAGASAKPNDFTTHIDKSIPSSITISGKTFDPAIPANIHEQVEREVMNNLIKRGMSNEKAYEIAHHEYAEPAEDAWYKANGVDVNEVNKQWAKWNKGTEQEKSTDKDFPSDLYKKPYAHDKVEGMKHTPSDVNQVWAMNDKFIPFNPMQPNPQGTNPGGHGHMEPIANPGRAVPVHKETPEAVYSAAIKTNSGEVHIGINHADAYLSALEAKGMKPSDHLSDEAQGFVTNKGRFVSRHEAADIADKQKQRSNDYVSPHGLLSEELDPSRVENVRGALRYFFENSEPPKK